MVIFIGKNILNYGQLVCWYIGKQSGINLLSDDKNIYILPDKYHKTTVSI